MCWTLRLCALGAWTARSRSPCPTRMLAWTSLRSMRHTYRSMVTLIMRWGLAVHTCHVQCYEWLLCWHVKVMCFISCWSCCCRFIQGRALSKLPRLSSKSRSCLRVAFPPSARTSLVSQNWRNAFFSGCRAASSLRVCMCCRQSSSLLRASMVLTCAISAQRLACLRSGMSATMSCMKTS